MTCVCPFMRKRKSGSVFFFQAEDGIRDVAVTGVQTCALPIYIATGLQLGKQRQSNSSAERQLPGWRRARRPRTAGGSSSSSARRNAHIARAIVNVKVTSGITIRVNRKSPTHVAMHKPAHKPALRPNAQMPNAQVRHASPMAESAKGIRAAQS